MRDFWENYHGNIEKTAQNRDFPDETLEIPEKELPPKPNSPKIGNLQEFLQRNDVKNKQLLGILQETAQKRKENADISQQIHEKSELSLKKQGLSEQLLLKVANFSIFIDFYGIFLDSRERTADFLEDFATFSTKPRKSRRNAGNC